MVRTYPSFSQSASALMRSGIPKIMATSRTLSTQIVSAPTPSTPEIVFKLQQEYKPKVLGIGKAVNSLVSLRLDGEGKVV